MALLNVRREHLRQCSNLLAGYSPSTAAALSMERLEVESHDHTTRKSKFDAICAACGSYDIRVHTIWPNNRTTQKPSRKSYSGPQRHLRMLTRSCTTCGRITKHELKAHPRHLNAAPSANSSEAKDVPLPDNVIKATGKSVGATSKKRAKTRKEGLQSLLEKSKQDSKPAPGFTLMDFMRSS